MKAKPDTNTVTVGLYAQRSFDLTPAISVTPHIGVRYIRADLDDFKAGGFSYKTDAANIVQFPVGVAFGAKTETMSGCKVNGFVDLSVVPAVGDKKSDMRFSLAGGSASDSVEGKIASTALYRANFGVNVKGGAHTLGASYGIGGGNGGRLDQTLKVNYRYAF
jgi:outer membrane autotransporter protein